MSAKFLQNILRAALLLVFFLFSERAYCQLIKASLDERIAKADVILEGKVTSKTSFWNQKHTQIYTANTVTVYKIFKGTLTAGEVEIITHGGIVGHDMETVTHTLELEVGDVGVFTAVPNKVELTQTSPRLRLKAYAGQQGFIKYNLSNGTASDPFTTYNSISTDVYSEITKRTKTQMSTVKKLDLKIN